MRPKSARCKLNKYKSKVIDLVFRNIIHNDIVAVQYETEIWKIVVERESMQSGWKWTKWRVNEKISKND